MKPILAMVCAVVFVLGLAGCAGKAKGPVEPIPAPAVVKTKG